MFWHIGGFDPARYTTDDQHELLAGGTLPSHLPSNHSPHFAPDPVLALPAAIAAMVTAARAELAMDSPA